MRIQAVCGTAEPRRRIRGGGRRCRGWGHGWSLGPRGPGCQGLISSGGAVANPGSTVSRVSGFCTNSPQFVRGGQILQAAQTEIFEEERGRSVGHRPADDLGAAGGLD